MDHVARRPGCAAQSFAAYDPVQRRVKLRSLTDNGLFTLLLLIFLALWPAFSAQIVEGAALVIDGTAKITWTDDNYMCATLDWWHKEKCNYNERPWGSSSLINLAQIIAMFVGFN